MKLTSRARRERRKIRRQCRVACLEVAASLVSVENFQRWYVRGFVSNEELERFLPPEPIPYPDFVAALEALNRR